MSKSPTTDALDSALKGDWQRCYETMHVHAVKLETALADALNEARQSRENLIHEKAVADTFRDQLKTKSADESTNVVGPLVARWEHMATLREDRAIEARTKGDIDMALCADNAAAAYHRCASELALAGGGLLIPAPGERWV